MEGLPGWVVSPMPGRPPRQHKHERQYTPSTHSVIPTRRIWNDDDDGQMLLGDLWGIKCPDICLTAEEKPRKTSPRKPVLTGDRTRARCVTSAHATTCSTAVNTCCSLRNLFCKLLILFWGHGVNLSVNEISVLLLKTLNIFWNLVFAEGWYVHLL